MLINYKTPLLALLLGMLLGGCQPRVSPDNYSAGSAGGAYPTRRGTIVAARQVTITNNNGTGTVAGASTGAIAGSSLGGGSRDRAIGMIGGAVVGGVLGSMAENKLATNKGMEYVIRMRDGDMLTIVQGEGRSLHRGQSVLVIFGQRVRVIADPEKGLTSRGKVS